MNSNYQNLVKKTSLSILSLSDLHMQHFQVENLLKFWKTQNKPNPDLILLLGDFDNLPMKEEVMSDKEICLNSETDITNLFRPIVEYFKDSVIYYIPGNHDSSNLFKPSYVGEIEKLGIQNIHEACVEFAHNLKLIGFGGSIPANNELTGQNVWQGYPYQSQQEYKQNLQKNLEKHLKIDDQLILATHIGTSTDVSSQSRYTSDPENEAVQGGSEYLSDIIKRKNEQEFPYQLFLNFHGHVHDAQGMSTYKGSRIINQGPLQFGQFGLTNIIYKEDFKKWKLEGVQFYDIN